MWIDKKIKEQGEAKRRKNGLLWLSDDGKVGIGCTNPQYKLDVNGTMRAKEVRVKITGCDFVLEENYKLQPLQERKLQVLKEKHLPDIPNAAGEVEMSSGVLWKGLWKNVEEHELYLYEMMEKIDFLQKEIELLKKENKALKQQLKP